MRDREAASVLGLPPATQTWPVDGGVSPQSTRSRVDLPAPFGPSNAVTPGSMANETSDTATRAPKALDTLSTTTVARGEIGGRLGAAGSGWPVAAPG